jgi:hypothetical protein
VIESLLDNWWVAAVLKAVACLGVFLTVPLIIGQAEHKVMAHMQGRTGPMYAGAFHGWAQLVADGIKFVQKEDVVPTTPTELSSSWPRPSRCCRRCSSDRHPVVTRAGRREARHRPLLCSALSSITPSAC